MSSKNRESVKLNKRKFAAYAVAGAAAALSANAAEAQVTFTTVGSPTGDITDSAGELFALTTNRFLEFNVLNGGDIAFAQIVDENDADVGNFAQNDGYTSNFALATGAPDTTVVVNDLTFSGGDASVRFENGQFGGPFSAGIDGFVAFDFTDEAGAQQFGFAEIAPLAGGDNLFTVERFAFTTAGETLAIGDAPAAATVPEPTSLGLLALGALGVLSSRRRKLTA